MKYLALAFLLGVAIQVVEPPEYPDGTFCTPQGDYVPGKGQTTPIIRARAKTWGPADVSAKSRSRTTPSAASTVTS
jgi:hypothetical protein